MTRLPSFESLRIFEVAARHGSFSKAADELHVTHSAVSQRIKTLELELGTRLFERRGARMLLTLEGTHLLRGVTVAIGEISRVVDQVRSIRRSEDLTVSLLPVMAARWLVPRLMNFTNQYPHINVNVRSGRTLSNFRSDGVDIAIRFGGGQWKDMEAIKLFDEELFPVCSPKFNRGQIPQKPSDLLSLPLLLDLNLPWRNWFAEVGIEIKKGDVRGTSFTDANLLLEAAIAGQGIALARGSIVGGEINSGRLVRLFQTSLRTSYSHYLVYPRETKKIKSIVVFRDWLLKEAARG